MVVVSLTSALSFNEVSCKLSGKIILDRVSLEIQQGAIVGILGPNGAGKSTLLSLALGLRKHSAGEITVLGTTLPRNIEKVRQRIGVVLQDTALYEELTTFENLRFSASLYNVTNVKQRIAEVLDLLMLAPRAHDLVKTLSGGLKRRVAIARALLHNPELLIIDEPTLGVDVEARHAIWSHLRLLKSQGHTTVVATNYLDEAQALCDRVAVLKDGKLMACETPENLIARAGQCLDVECREEVANAIAENLCQNAAGVLRVDRVPGGLTVVLPGEAVSSDVVKIVMQNSQISGFRLRAPDLVEVFKSLDKNI